MAIHVTPIPRLTSLVTPAFGLGTANAAGDAITAVASNSTLLTFDTTLPVVSTYAGSSAVGSATVTARRDHKHGLSALPDVSCRVYNDASQNIANGTPTKLAFNAEYFDTDSFHDNTTNNSRLTIPEDGKYLCGVSFTIAGTSGHVNVGILLNNTANIALAALGNISGASIAPAVSTIADLDADDYIEANVYQDSGGTVAVSYAANYTPNFWIVKIGP